MTSEFVHSLRIRVPKWIISWAFLISDTIAGILAFYIVFLPASQELQLDPMFVVGIFVVITVAWACLFFILGLYKATSDVSRFGEIQRAIIASFSCIVLMIFLQAVQIVTLPYEPAVVLNYWLFFILCFSLVRFSSRSLQKAMIRKGIGLEKMIIVGHNPRGEKVARDIEKQIGRASCRERV